MKNMLGEKLWMRGTIAAQLGLPLSKVLCVEHHLSHAAASFIVAPCSQAAIMVADGVGEWATLTVGTGVKHRDGTLALNFTQELRYPHSLGLLYSTFTAFLGFPVNEGEYKVMGLAAYGEPTFRDKVNRVITPTGDGGFALDMRYFDFDGRTETSYSPAFVALFGRPRGPYEPLDPTTPEGRRYADIAASVQHVLENVLVGIARALRQETKLDTLCLGGGVALNGVANARILEEAGFSEVSVPSAPGDAGCALGAALAADRLIFGSSHRSVPNHPFWGPQIVPAELERLALEDRLDPIRAGEDALIAQTAAALHGGAIVGWMQGALEFGPRALGHRSILAAPQDAAMRDRLNRSTKFREEFRPFAPVVTYDQADRYFRLPVGGARLGRFMSGVFPVRPEWRDRLAAVTHIDGTARVQVLEPEMEPQLARLLDAYGRLSGMPILLNTSFNLAGEPIVNTIAEGYSTFRRSGIDLLVAGDVLLSQPQRAAASLAKATA